MAGSDDWAEAREAFDAGEYRQAVDIYREVVARGHINGHIFYNMGIAYYRLQEQGEAMASLLAARRYLPRDPDVEFNLRFVEEKIADNLTSVIPRKFYDLVGVIGDYLTEKEMGFMSLVLLALALVLLTCFLFARQFVFLFKLGVLVFVLAALSAIFLQAKSLFPEHWGAIVAKKVNVYSGPNLSNTTLFELHEGAPLIVERETNDFWQIRLSDGKRGWIAADTARSFSFRERL